MLFVKPTECQTANNKASQHWQETVAETIWRGVYSNCDYGYYVDLPVGMVAHSGKPPSSNHGSVIDLAEPSSASPLATPLSRYIKIWNQYNAANLPSLSAIVDAELKSMRSGDSDFELVGRKVVRLDDLHATSVMVRFKERGVDVAETKVIAYRPPGPAGLGDIIYEISLVTTIENGDEDRATFQKVLLGFHTTALPEGVCVNN